MSFNRGLAQSMFGVGTEKELRDKLYGRWSDLTPAENGCILRRLSEFDEPKYCEIGVYFGGNFFNVSEFLKSSKENYYMYGIDLFENLITETQESQTHDLFNKWNMLNISVHGELTEALRNFGSEKFSLLKGYSHRIAAHLPEKCDVFFIDGNHTYEQTMLDALACSKRASGGSYLIFHNASDNIKPDPEYVEEDGGPHRVVEDLCKDDKFEFVERIERCAVVRVRDEQH